MHLSKFKNIFYDLVIFLQNIVTMFEHGTGFNFSL